LNVTTVDHRVFLYALDEADNLSYVNEEWLAFAVENGAARLTRDLVLHRPIKTFITGRDLQQLWQFILMKVRTEKPLLRLPFRCDSPDCRRLMEVTIRRQPPGNLMFQTKILEKQPRDPVRLLAEKTPPARESIPCCSWCNRLSLPNGEWVEVEDAVQALKLFEVDPLPHLTPRLCDACSVNVRKVAARLSPLRPSDFDRLKW
jgi:hypothetical protein